MQVKGKNSTQLKFEAIQTDTIHSLLETYINIHSNIFEKLPPFLIDVFFLLNGYNSQFARLIYDVWNRIARTQHFIIAQNVWECVCALVFVNTQKKTHALASIAC